ncbi:MAG: VanZ family protein [Ruminococcaceae bacterium]|nr:VanZ family protein [Oscillospiraceae bacterium]
MTLNRKVLAVVLSLLSVFWIFFIFSNSAETASESNDKSYDVVEIIIEKVLREDLESKSKAEISIINNFIRKLAHFSEFAVLSLFAFLSFWAWNLKSFLRYFLPVTAAFFVACTDEIIQYFVPGRACRFTDVLIDTGGAVFLIIVVVSLKLIFLKIKSIRGNDE